MELIVDTDTQIEFKPETEIDEIKQNIMTIISINQYEQPLNRAFGIDASFVDKPVNIAKSKAAAAILKAVNDNEPRVNVKSVYFEEFDLKKGKMRVILEVEIVPRN